MKVVKDTPGPHRMMAWKPGDGIESACGMLRSLSDDRKDVSKYQKINVKIRFKVVNESEQRLCVSLQGSLNF